MEDSSSPIEDPVEEDVVMSDQEEEEVVPRRSTRVLQPKKVSEIDYSTTPSKRGGKRSAGGRKSTPSKRQKKGDIPLQLLFPLQPPSTGSSVAFPPVENGGSFLTNNSCNILRPAPRSHVLLSDAVDAMSRTMSSASRPSRPRLSTRSPLELKRTHPPRPCRPRLSLSRQAPSQSLYLLW